MNIYVEKNIRFNPITQHILEAFTKANILEIENYKNLFDKPQWTGVQKSMILASVNNALFEIPKNYGFDGDGYFLKNSLNCVYDCSYCYLKWAFKNDTPVFFVNYEEIKAQIQKKIIWKDEITWFYSSDYSDNLATNSLSLFVENFVPFFETLPNAMMEIRTKSVNIEPLLKFKNIEHTEIAFSLNPTEIIQAYEQKTPSLKLRLQAINTLIEAGWKVGIRFLPLLEVPDYQEIYTNFLTEVMKEIDFTKIHSVFIGALLYTQEDYTQIRKKYPKLDILYRLQKESDWFVRERREVRDFFYQLFSEKLQEKKCRICLDD